MRPNKVRELLEAARGDWVKRPETITPGGWSAGIFALRKAGRTVLRDPMFGARLLVEDEPAATTPPRDPPFTPAAEGTPVPIPEEPEEAREDAVAPVETLAPPPFGGITATVEFVSPDDPEVCAIGLCVEAVKELEAAAIRRVLYYVGDRFGAAL